MNIKFYNNKAENNRLDKSEFLTETLSCKGKLRDSCSIVEPTIKIEDRDIITEYKEWFGNVVDSENRNVVIDTSIYNKFNINSNNTALTGVNYTIINNYNLVIKPTNLTGHFKCVSYTEIILKPNTTYNLHAELSWYNLTEQDISNYRPFIILFLKKTDNTTSEIYIPYTTIFVKDTVFTTPINLRNMEIRFYYNYSSYDVISLDESITYSNIMLSEGAINLPYKPFLGVADTLDFQSEFKTDVPIGVGYNILSSNYCYIEDFGRYYYITDITCVAEKIWEVSMTCDVLMSFKEEILELDAFVLRQEFDISPDIPDNKMPVLSEPLLNIITTDDSGDLYNPINNALTAFSYVMIIGGADQNFDFTYASGLKTPLYVPYITNITGIERFAEYAYNYENDGRIERYFEPSEAVKSIYRIPFELQTYLENKFPNGDGRQYEITENIYISNQISHLNATFIKVNYLEPIEIYGGSITINRFFNNFLDYSDYTSIKLFIPFLGYIDLDVDICLGKTIQLYYVLNILKGTALVKLVVDNKVIKLIDSQMAIFSPITRGDYNQKKLSHMTSTITNALNFGKNLAQTVAGIIAAPATGGLSLGASIAGAGGMINSISGQISSDLQNKFNKVSLGEGGDNIELLELGIKMFAIVIRTNPVYIHEDSDYTDRYRHLVGSPSSYNGKLKNLQGYTEVGGIHIEGISRCTTEEQEKINYIIRSGVIL